MASIQILVGTVYGGALMTARAIRTFLTEQGHDVTVHENPTLDALTGTEGPVLVCTSTTGQGEVPANLLPFYLELRDLLPPQPDRPFGMIVLGDSSYGDTYCGAGSLMEEALLETGARKTGDTLCIDAMETTEPEGEALPWVKDWIRSTLAG